MVGRILFYTRRLFSGGTMPFGPLTSLRPLYCRVMCRLSNTKLSVWSSCLSSLFPAHPHHLLRAKAEQKKVPYWRRACVLLKRHWQDSLLTRSLPLEFEQTWPKGRCLPVSLLAPYTFSSIHLCIVVTVHLTCDHLRVAVKNRTYGFCCFNEV